MDCNIIKPHDMYGWITLVIGDRWVQAKVFDTPSIYGVNNCRVSKLSIAKSGVQALGVHTGLDFFDNIDYNYDRGLDLHTKSGLPQSELDDILFTLNNLPILEGASDD